ncbi:type IV toxin-antitoxin system AbiEi family antitoxin domain-containing protein [Arthrobacter sp. GCM10027362]
MAEQVGRLGGTARLADLHRAGFTRAAIDAAVRSGAIRRVRRGLVGVPGGNPDIRRALMANGLITCVSAARELGLWTLKQPADLHLWTDHGRVPASVATHRGSLAGRRLPGAYVGVADAVLHTLRCRPALEAMVVAESALRLGAVRRQELLEHLPGARNGVYRRLVGRLRTDAESPLEIIARELFRQAGLRVEAQVHIRGLGRVDLLVEGCVIVELDGMDFHWNRETFRKDRVRNNQGVLAGLPTLRYVYEDLVFRPDAVLAQVRSMVRRVS